MPQFETIAALINQKTKSMSNDYNAWRISFQDPEQAAREAFKQWQRAEQDLAAVGAGGVEPLRQPKCLTHIEEPSSEPEQ